VRFPKTAVAFVLAVLPLAFPLLAQSPNGTINGLVLDPSKNVIAGADLLVINDVTGVKYSTRTNPEGIYVMPNLPPGPYRLQVSKPGFKTIVKPDIVLNVQDALSINFTLPIGATFETLTVQGGAPLVSTESGAVSTVVDRQFVANLPLNGRSFNTLMQLTPGVVIAQQPAGALNGGAPGQFSVSGQRTDANNFTVDGVSANFGVVPSYASGASGTGTAQAFSVLGGTSSLVSVEALEEFRIETSSFAPEFGRSSGGQVVLTTRSGTNRFHGEAYEYFRNDVLDASNWFNGTVSPPLPKAAERHNDFGGFLGGPIQKNKTFFFFSYEGARLRLPQTQIIQVPSAYARSVAPSSIAPFVNAYPQPDDRTPIPGVYTSQFTGDFSDSATLNAASLRIDHEISSRFSIFGRYNYAPSKTISRVQTLNDLNRVELNTQTLTVGLNMSLSHTIFNAVRGNYSTQNATSVYSMDSFGGASPIDPGLMIGGLSIDSTNTSFGTPDTNIRYLLGPGAHNRARQLNFVDDLVVAVGAHEIKLGGDYRTIFFNSSNFQHSAEFTPASIPDFLSNGSAGLFVSTVKPAQLLSQALSLYAEDSWKASPRLTLVYGIRWELTPAPSGRNGTILGAWTSFNDPASLALAPAGTHVWKTDYTNFAPRFGIAYSLTSDGKLVLHAGAGVFFDVGVGSAADLATHYPNQAFGFSPSVSLPVGDLTPYLPTISFAPPYPVYVEAFSPTLNTPRSYQWNVAIEKQMGAKQALSFTYLGQAGRQLLRQEALFQPNANFSGDFLATVNDAFSNYHALQVQYRRQLSAGLQALANYTWAHSLDNASNDVVDGLPSNVISAASDYGNSDFDVRHSFSGALTYDIPVRAGKSPVYALARDWSVSSVIVARSSFPFNLQLFGTSPDPLGFATTRPDLIAGQPLWTRVPTAPGGQIVNAQAFSIPGSVRQGTEPRNDIPGFGLTEVDLSLARKFPIGDRVTIHFRVDAFNVFNHPNFANPLGFLEFGPTYLGSTQMLNQALGGLNPLFQQGGPRSLQLSLKLVF
jgi:Carboxypeptidase regulatory-like domain